MTSDQRPDSLAAQAASWVPPWEREQRPLDRDFQAAAQDPDVSDGLPEPEAGVPVEAAEPAADVSVEAAEPAAAVSDEAAEADAADQVEDRPVEVPLPDDDEDRSAASLSDDDDDFDPAFEGANPPGYDEVPPELPPIPGESGGAVTVDAPTEVPGETEPDPTDLSGDVDLPLPVSIEDADADADDDEAGRPVDAPLPPDGDDAGDVFDAAADDDLSDDAELDLPFSEDVPGSDDDEPATLAPDDADVETEAAAAQAAGGGAGTAGAEVSAADVGGGAVLAAFEAGRADAAAAFSSGAASSGAASSGAASSGAASSGAAEAQRAEPRSVVPPQGRKSAGPGVAGGEANGRTAKVVTSGDAEPAADDELSPMDDTDLRAALEAVLLVVDEPVAEMQLAQILEQPTERVGAMLEDISARYTAAGHGFDLRRAAGGWRLYTRPEYAAYVEKFVLDGQSLRMTQAALETVAVVAYRQPVTRSRISAIRGVNCDGVMRTLVTRGLIEECGTEGETGAYLYRTTPLFLEKLGLNSVDQLPPLAPFLPDDVEEVLDASG